MPSRLAEGRPLPAIPPFRSGTGEIVPFAVPPQKGTVFFLFIIVWFISLPICEGHILITRLKNPVALKVSVGDAKPVANGPIFIFLIKTTNLTGDCIAFSLRIDLNQVG